MKKQKKIKFLKIRHLKNSGCDPIHVKVMNEFRESKASGISYCKKRDWNVSLTDVLLTVKSKAMFGFEFVALIEWDKDERSSTPHIIR